MEWSKESLLRLSKIGKVSRRSSRLSQKCQSWMALNTNVACMTLGWLSSMDWVSQRPSSHPSTGWVQGLLLNGQRFRLSRYSFWTQVCSFAVPNMTESDAPGLVPAGRTLNPVLITSLYFFMEIFGLLIDYTCGLRVFQF